MKNKIKRLIGTAAAAIMLLSTPAMSQDKQEKVCETLTITQAGDIVIAQKVEYYVLTQLEDINAAFDRVGAVAEIGTDTVLVVFKDEYSFIIEFGDNCMILQSPPLPKALGEKFLNRVNASQ